MELEEFLIEASELIDGTKRAVGVAPQPLELIFFPRFHDIMVNLHKISFRRRREAKTFNLNLLSGLVNIKSAFEKAAMDVHLLDVSDTSDRFAMSVDPREALGAACETAHYKVRLESDKAARAE